MTLRLSPARSSETSSCCFRRIGTWYTVGISRTTRIWSTSTEQCNASLETVASARGCSHRQAT